MSEFTEFTPEAKHCSVCRDKLPLDAAHFDRDRSSDDGFRNECKQCRAELRKKVSDEEIDERLQQLDRAALTMLQAAAMKEYSKVPHIAEVFECLMRVFGGPQGFAEHFLGTYLSAKPGSQQRIKLLNIVSMLANQATQSGAVKVPKDLLSDEDLEREITETAKRLIVLRAPEEDVA